MASRNQGPQSGPPQTGYLTPINVAPAPMIYEGPARDTRGASSATGGADIWKLFQTLYRRKFFILATFVLGITIAAVLTLRVPARYAASATLEVQAQETQIIQGANVEPASVANSEFIGTQIALMKSRALAERVAENLNLADEPLYAYPGSNHKERVDQAAGAILGGLAITPVRGARVIELRYVSPVASETARIANAVSENFIEMNIERRYNATAYARKFLEERLAVAKSTLEDTERRLVQYSSEKQIIDLSSVGGSEIGSSLDASSLVSLNSSLTEAQNQRILAEQKYREAVENPSTREMLESPAIQELRRTRSQLAADYQTKLATLQPEHPQMLDLRSRMDTIDKSIESERTNLVKALEAEYKTDQARETALAQRVQELKGQVLDLRTRSIDYNILRREADTTRTQYDALLQRLKEVSIGSAVGSSQVSILDHAQQPILPFEPDLIGSLIRAAAISLAVAVALALFIEFLDGRIKTPEDVTSELGVRVLGVIPKVKGRHAVTKLLRNPKSNIAEAFSSTRAALQFAIIAGDLKSFLITGSKPSEGKTTTAMALAASFAAIGKKVLIIDADLRRPSFAFDANASAGVSGILSQGLQLADQVLPGPTANLHLLPAGVVPPNPAELLAGTRLHQLMEEAVRQYDLVFVDSPPVLAFADAPILSSVCDGTILVVQSGGSFQQTIRRAVERLQAAQASITGAVLTKFDAKKAGYGAMYGYYQGGYDQIYGRLPSGAAAARRVRLFEETETPAKDDLVG